VEIGVDGEALCALRAGAATRSCGPARHVRALHDGSARIPASRCPRSLNTHKAERSCCLARYMLKSSARARRIESIQGQPRAKPATRHASCVRSA